MRKRKGLIFIVALMMLAACNMTSFAVSKTSNGIKAELNRWGNTGVCATSESVTLTNRNAYVCVTEEYISDVGNIYLSSPGGVVNTMKAYTHYTAPGTFLSAWSDHGHTSEIFNLYI